MEIKLIFSLFLLIPANYFGGLRDWYFWDQQIKSYIKKYYKDWHIVKLLNLGFLLISFALACFSWKAVILWLILRYTIWEIILHIIDKEYKNKMKSIKRTDIRKMFYITPIWGSVLIIVSLFIYRII